MNEDQLIAMMKSMIETQDWQGYHQQNLSQKEVDMDNRKVQQAYKLAFRKYMGEDFSFNISGSLLKYFTQTLTPQEIEKISAFLKNNS